MKISYVVPNETKKFRNITLNVFYETYFYLFIRCFAIAYGDNAQQDGMQANLKQELEQARKLKTTKQKQTHIIFTEAKKRCRKKKRDAKMT